MKKNVFKLVIAGTVLFALVFCAFSGARVRAYAAESNTAKLTVEGYGCVELRPAYVFLNFGANTFGREVTAAVRENAEVFDRICAALAKIGIADGDYESISYNIYPEYDYYEGRSVQKGYRVNNEIRVKLRDVASAGAAIDAVTAAGANTINGLSFGADAEAFYLSALEQAMANAYQKAKLLSGGAELSLSSVKEAQNYGAGRNIIMKDSYMSSSRIAGGTLKAEAYITAEYVLK